MTLGAFAELEQAKGVAVARLVQRARVAVAVLFNASTEERLFRLPRFLPPAWKTRFYSGDRSPETDVPYQWRTGPRSLLLLTARRRKKKRPKKGLP